jgi:hypothetical protein
MDSKLPSAGSGLLMDTPLFAFEAPA